MKRPVQSSLFHLVLLAMATTPAFAQEKTAPTEPTVEQIVAAANRVGYYQGRDGRAQVKMVIVDGQGRERVREMTILRRDQPAAAAGETAGGAKVEADDSYCGEQRFYVRFKRPADVDKTTFLVWKRPGEDDSRWLYLPALDLVKPISAADKRSSFVGSNFYYEDVSGRHIAADTHELIETTKDYYVIRSVPKDAKSAEFAAYKMWIHRASSVVVKVEYRDDKDEVYRTYEALAVDQVQGYPTVTKAKMTDLRSKGHTIVTYTDVAYDLDLPEEIFTERYLRQAPRRYMR
ncbi:MAG: outer membrane lipoprotein-sorting protein [Planctomycetes bacterium]|nr:outer membrane lipoprotein-sorting protein [Planctomycetota bacterium]